MTSKESNSLDHLSAHHRDFDQFRLLMEQTHVGRFDSVFWGFLKKHLDHPDMPSIRTIVDLGTGPGGLLIDLESHFPQAQIIGVETQPAMLAAANKRIAGHPRLKMIGHDLAQTPIHEIPSQSTQLIVASMVLHELQVPTNLIDEVKRILQPGGVWIFYDWVRQPLASYCEGKRPTTLDEFTHFSEHCRYTPEDLQWLFEQSGFQTLEWLARHEGQHALFALTTN